MIVKQAEFVISNTKLEFCPKPDRPEYAFIGRSNVGKSSLINMLTNKKGLAKTSSTPGKTRLINHFDINGEWYLVDLPGYGYAKLPKQMQGEFEEMIFSYIKKRENLINLFVLIDSRHDPQKIDLKFMAWLGENQVPFSIVMTKIDKLSSSGLNKNLRFYKAELLKSWESLPPVFLTSAANAHGREDVLNYIQNLNKSIDFRK